MSLSLVVLINSSPLSKDTHPPIYVKHKDKDCLPPHSQ